MITWNDVMEALNHKEELALLINSNTDIIIDVFGEDYWDFLYGVGTDIAYRCKLHLDGIKRASIERAKIMKDKEDNETLSN